MALSLVNAAVPLPAEVTVADALARTVAENAAVPATSKRAPIGPKVALRRAVIGLVAMGYMPSEVTAHLYDAPQNSVMTTTPAEPLPPAAVPALLYTKPPDPPPP